MRERPRAPRRASLAAAALGLGAVLHGGRAAAAAQDLVVPGAAGQQGIAVRASETGVLAKVCAAPCSPADGVPLAFSGSEVSRLQLADIRVRAIALANGRSIVRIEATPRAGGASWTMLVAAPLVDEGNDPIVFWKGLVGVSSGEHGEARKNVVVEEPLARGVRVVLGQQREDVAICGRAATTNARALDPATLRFEKGATLAQGGLSADERAKAPKLAATRIDGAPAPRPMRLFAMRAASSAIDARVLVKASSSSAIGTLTDGDLDTSWSEGKVGDGRGEFVTFASASEVPVTGLEIAVRPGLDVPNGAAPRSLFVATDDKLFAVSLPEDAWGRPAHTRYAVTFPEPLRSSCVAIVLDAAHTRGAAQEARVTLAEVTARTAFDEMGIDALVGALAGGGDRARGAGAMLERGGAPAARAAMASYAKLDDAARELARRVIDEAPCGEKAPFYAALFAEATARGRKAKAAPGDVDPDFVHARDRLRTCNKEGGLALVKLLSDPNEKTRLAAADELPLLSPSSAVPALIDALASAPAGRRTEILAALAVAARSPRAVPAISAELEPARFGARPEPLRLALLRAIGPALPRAGAAASAAFATLAIPGASFAARWHLQAPAAELARGGDARATDYLRTSLLHDADAHVRRRAAEVAAKLPALRADLVVAIDDPDVRVREGAIEALAASDPGAAAAAPLARRLTADDWPFVRAAAAHALAGLPARVPVDGPLAAALEDASPEVRGRALDGLGARHAVAHVDAIRALATSSAEIPDVRAHAITALGLLCDRRLIDALTEIARRGAQPFDEDGRRLAPAALGALAAIHPADLEARLAPLLAKEPTSKAPRGQVGAGSSGPVRELAKAALRTPGACR